MASTILCSLGAGAHAELLAMTTPTLEAWARRFGYDLELRTQLLAPERPPSWSKVLQVLQHLRTHRVVLWVDADAVVVDGREDLAARVSEQRPLAMVAHVYGGQTVPNLGVFAVRTGEDTIDLLQRLWRMTGYVQHKWWENAAFLDVLGYDIATEPIVKARPSAWDDRVAWLGPEWNSLPGLVQAERPIITHYAGRSHQDRLRLMAADLEAWRAR